MPGPPPKRSGQRRRQNPPEPGQEVTKAPTPGKVTAPRPDPKWHPVAKRLYLSLAKSGQSAFYTESDYGTAYLLAESISRELNPQPFPMKGPGGETFYEMVSLPPKGASLAAWLKGLTSLMATEGDRRRARLELERPVPEEAKADVSELAQYRNRIPG